MQLLDLKLNIAENLNQLSADGATIAGGRVTEAGITRKINQIYRDDLFPMLSDRFPQDFEQETYPQATYSATGTGSSSSTGTTLVATTGIFDNTMEGFTVENATDSTTAEIVTYTNTTTVTLDTTIGDTWDGDTIYVRGNEYVLGGETTDIKEIRQVLIKYTSTDDWTECKRMNKEDAVVVDENQFSTSEPVFYLTTIDVSGVLQQGIGFMPYPTSYAGKFKVVYIEKPAALSSATDTTMLQNIGIDQVIVDGVTAWGYSITEKWKAADRYRTFFQEGKRNLLTNYKPKQRSGPKHIGVNPYYLLYRNRQI
jgi:hypothetical protein